MQTFDITGMSCTACSARVEKAVSSLPKITYCSVNLMTNTLVTEGSASPEEIINAVRSAGYGASVSDTKDYFGRRKTKKELSSKFVTLIVSVVFLIPLLYLGMGINMFSMACPTLFLKYPFINPLLQIVLYVCIFVINRRFFISGFKALLYLSPNMDTLVSLGSGVSFVYSVVLFALQLARGETDSGSFYFESAAMILVFVSFGKLLESEAKDKTAKALDSLSKLAPANASVITDGREKIIPASEVLPGDIFVVRPGEKFPADGIVLEGRSAVDESAFTGESMPVDKEPGAEVFTATLNKSGFLRCKAVKTGSDTALAAMVKAAGNAAATKAPVTRLADKIAAVLVPAVIGISLVTFVIWMICGKDVSFCIERAVAVLVITCPCSLGLATPVAITVAGGIGAKKGILFKNAAALETLSAVRTVVFDKTGTLTKGTPRVAEITYSPEFCESQCLLIAGSLENLSEHPLAKAVVRDIGTGNLSFADVSDFKTHPGCGVSGTVGDIFAEGGSLKYISCRTSLSDDVLSNAREMSEKGMTPLIFTANGRYLCTIALTDSLRDNASLSVKKLKEMNIKTVLLTGDNINTAKAAADLIEIDEYYGEAMPDKKVEIIMKLKEESPVAMVGDGVNDGAALACADVGMAIGAGTDTAIDSCDLVLMRSDISDAVTSIVLSRRTMKIIKENLFWAFFYNMLCIPLAAGVLIPAFGISLSPMWCALCMSLSSFCVVINSMRLNYIFRDKTKKETDCMKITLKIEGMMCSHCEARVKNGLEALSYVSSADVSHRKNRAVVEVTEEGREEDLKKTVEELGYKVL